MFYAVFMSFFPYFVCAWLGVDSLRGGLAEGNRIYQGVLRNLVVENSRLFAQHAVRPLV